MTKQSKRNHRPILKALSTFRWAFISIVVLISSSAGAEPLRIAIAGTNTDFVAHYLLKKWGLQPDKDVAIFQAGASPKYSQRSITFTKAASLERLTLAGGKSL
jgi:hypothetical protein